MKCLANQEVKKNFLGSNKMFHFDFGHFKTFFLKEISKRKDLSKQKKKILNLSKMSVKHLEFFRIFLGLGGCLFVLPNQFSKTSMDSQSISGSSHLHF